MSDGGQWGRRNRIMRSCHRRAAPRQALAHASESSDRRGQSPAGRPAELLHDLFQPAPGPVELRLQLVHLGLVGGGLGAQPLGGALPQQLQLLLQALQLEAIFDHVQGPRAARLTRIRRFRHQPLQTP